MLLFCFVILKNHFATKRNQSSRPVLIKKLKQYWH